MINVRYVVVYSLDKRIFGRFKDVESALRYINMSPMKVSLRYKWRQIDIQEYEDLDVQTEYCIQFFPNEGGKHPRQYNYTGKKRHPEVFCALFSEYVIFKSSESMEHCEQLLRENIARALHWVNVARREPLDFQKGITSRRIIDNYEWNLDI